VAIEVRLGIGIHRKTPREANHLITIKSPENKAPILSNSLENIGGCYISTA
jgi:hypothetical protein